MAADVRFDDTRMRILAFFLASIPWWQIAAEELPSFIELEKKGSVFHYRIPKVYRTEYLQEGKSFWVVRLLPSVKEISLTENSGLLLQSDSLVAEDQMRSFLNFASTVMGTLPNWNEVLLLSREKSSSFDHEFCELGTHKEEEIQSILDEEEITLESFSRVPRNCASFQVWLDDFCLRSLLINSTSQLCMGHDRYSLRILDHEEKIVWEAENLTKGDLSVRLKWRLGGPHTVFLHENDHGLVRLLTVEVPEASRIDESK